MIRKCPSCGFGVSATAKFCSECGSPIRPPAAEGAPFSHGRHAPPGEGERRQLTVLFCDLAGSTRLSSELDPEDWHDVLTSYQRTCAAVVERFGGYVAQFLGDGILIYFGYPAAREDDAVRATRTAVEIVDAIDKLNPTLRKEHGRAIAVRLGLHTGTVVVGRVGSAARRETLALGGATHVAARLQELAKPNTVVLSETTHRLVHAHFETDPIGVRTLRGVTQPVEVFQAIRPVRVRRALGAADEELTPLVGRNVEARLLHEKWSLAREGKGQAVILSGEAGIGKTRMTLNLARQLETEPHTWLSGRCSAYTQSSPLYPVVTLQQDAVRLDTYAGADAKIERLANTVRALGMDDAAVVPLFAPLHSLPLPPRYADPGLSADARRKRTMLALVEWLERVARQQPLVAVVEDLHWVDPSTLELLGQLGDRLRDQRILLLLTHRPDFAPVWSGTSSATFVTLGRLTREDSTALAETVKTRPDLPAELMSEIVTKADGIPLYLEELTRAVMTQSQDAGPRRSRGIVVPETLTDSLMARLDQLGPAKELAQICAVIGRESSFELIRAVTSLDPAPLRERLDTLVQSQLFTRNEPQQTYSFRHALIQEQAYQSLLKSVRQSYHTRIAEALAQHFPETAASRPEILAHHFAEAGQGARSVSYWLQAGQKSLERSASVEAGQQLERGLAVLLEQPESRERDQQELLLRSVLGVALIASHGYAAPEVERSFDRAYVLCTRLGETPHLFPVLFGLFLFALVRAARQASGQLEQRLWSIAKSTADTEFLLEAHSGAGARRFWLGDFHGSQDHLLQARMLYDPAKHGHQALVYGQDPLAYGYSYGAFNLWFTGYAEQARQSASQALLLANRLGHPLTVAGILSFTADLHHLMGELDAFERLADRAIQVAEEQGLPMWAAAGLALKGTAVFERGDHRAGIEQIREGVERFLRTGARLNSAYIRSRLVRALLEDDQVDEGLREVELAIESAENSLDRYYLPEIYRLKAELLGRREPARAERAYLCALSLARKQDAKVLELRTAVGLARAQRTTHRNSPSAQRIADLVDWFCEGLDQPDLTAARAFLDSLDG